MTVNSTPKKGENKILTSNPKLSDKDAVDYGLEKKDANKRRHGLLFFLTEWDHSALLYMTILTFIIRLAFLDHPSVVIFDEVHFGGFAQKYLKRQFFSDLHPPLARLLVTLSAWLGGFNGNFSFYNIGADYIKPGVPYVVMRAFTAISGALVIPIAYLTMRAMQLSEYTSLAVSSMLILDNALMTQSRLILLDSYLVLFTALIPFFWVLFQQQKSRPFSREWHLTLLGLGTSMALAASCKWVGLFAVVAVGLFTVADLWQILGNVKIPLKSVGKHFGFRVLSLIVIPLIIYASTFWVHFAMLRDYTPAAAGMSLEFQQTLNGGKLNPTMAKVFYGSVVRIRQYKSDGPFLHSHAHMFPAGSKQQQVTGYHHRDQNNLWIVRRPYVVNETYVKEQEDETTTLNGLHHNDLLRLEHVSTGRFLHSHQVDPPLSNKEKQHEISCYGHNKSKFSDTNDNWRIEIVDDMGNSITEDADDKYKPQILAIGTKFRLVHRNLLCKLHCRNKALPEWAYKQGEMTCGKETKKINQIWIIESNEHPKATEEELKNTITLPKKGFLGKFIELNKRMWDSNAGLSEHHPFGSRPLSWPLLIRGIGFWNGHHIPKTEKQHEAKKKKKGSDEDTADDEGAQSDTNPIDDEDKAEVARLTQLYNKFKGQQIYLLGNVIVWWSATASLAVYIGTLLLYRVCKKRNFSLATKMENSILGKQLTFMSLAGFMFLQWVWHFVPFFGMKRQLFLHHYLPALYFSVLLFAILLDSILSVTITSLKLNDSNSKKVRILVLVTLVLATTWVFWKLAPLGYGLRMSKTQCESIKWLKRWDFDCNSLVDPVSKSIVTGSS